MKTEQTDKSFLASLIDEGYEKVYTNVIPISTIGWHECTIGKLHGNTSYKLKKYENKKVKYLIWNIKEYIVGTICEVYLKTI